MAPATQIDHEESPEMKALATWCVRHRVIVLLLWLAALVGMTLLRVGGQLPTQQLHPAQHRIDPGPLPAAGGGSRAWPATGSRSSSHTTDGTKVTDPSSRAASTPCWPRSEGPPRHQHHQSLRSEGANQISADRTTAFATVTFDQQSQYISVPVAKQFVATAQTADGPSLQVAVAGQVAEAADRPSFGGTGLGVLLAGVVLFLVFGSIFAMALPLLSALASLGTAIGLIGLFSHVLKMPQFSTELVLLIGLGVGRGLRPVHRDPAPTGTDRRQGRRVVHRQAVNTSGRAVLFAGIIVCIALLGMFALGVSFLYGLAIAAAIGVLFTMIAALTLLPAFLGFIGPGSEPAPEEGAGPQRTQGRRHRDQGLLAEVGGVHPGRPVVPAVVALLVVLVALPFFSLRLGSSDQGNDPVGTTTRTGLRPAGQRLRARLQRAAPAGGPERRAGRPGARQPGRCGGGSSPAWRRPRPGEPPDQGRQDRGLITVYPTTSPEAGATTDLIDHLRQCTIPAAVAGTGVTVYVGGNTAIFVDFARVLSAKLPLFIGLVVVLSFLLLAMVFRSLLIPLTGGGDEPVVHRRGLRGGGGGVPVGMAGLGLRGRPGRAHRGVPAGDAVRHPLRAVHGLRGVPRQPNPRGVPEHRGQPDRGTQGPGRHRQDHHRRRPDHDPGVRLVHPGRGAGHQGVRPRLGRRHPDRCPPHPHGHRPLADVPHRQGQLVVPGVARPDPPPPLRRSRTADPAATRPGTAHRSGARAGIGCGAGHPPTLDNRVRIANVGFTQGLGHQKDRTTEHRGITCPTSS